MRRPESPEQKLWQKFGEPRPKRLLRGASTRDAGADEAVRVKHEPTEQNEHFSLFQALSGPATNAATQQAATLHCLRHRPRRAFDRGLGCHPVLRLPRRKPGDRRTGTADSNDNGQEVSMSGHMVGLLNGKPCWSPSARTKDWDFGPVMEPDDDNLSLMAAAPQLVRDAVKKGLIKFPNPNEVATAKLGSRSVMATCQTCKCEFSRDKFSIEPQCNVCRIPRKTCKQCGNEFQPVRRKQLVCGMACRIELARIAAQSRVVGTVTVPCAWCGNMFERRAGEVRIKHCGAACGYKTMAAKLRKK